MPSELDREDPRLLSRIMQLRGYANTRDAMRSEKERERDHKYATTQSEMAKLVAKVRFMIQRGMTDEEIEAED